MHNGYSIEFFSELSRTAPLRMTGNVEVAGDGWNRMFLPTPTRQGRGVTRPFPDSGGFSCLSQALDALVQTFYNHSRQGTASVVVPCLFLLSLRGELFPTTAQRTPGAHLFRTASGAVQVSNFTLSLLCYLCSRHAFHLPRFLPFSRFATVIINTLGP